jgi:hypothetical protein
MALFAQEERNLVRPPALDRAEGPRLLLRRDQPLREAERLDLESRGVRVLRIAGGNDYIVRGPRAAAAEFGEVREFTPAAKLQRTAEQEIASIRPFSRLRVTFHDDVSFEEARGILQAAGAALQDPLTTDLDFLNAVEIVVPDGAVERLLRADEVIRLSGPRLKILPDNAAAATLSAVPPLYSTPYDLSGAGVQVSLWDCGHAQADHPEFGGRLTAHDNRTSASPSQHPTHVAGTIGASGVQAAAKGMAPAVTLHQYDVGCGGGSSNFLASKNTAFPQRGIRADNNSFSFVLGWRLESAGEWKWYGNQEYFGTYVEESAGVDKLARAHGTLMMFSAGNDANDTGPLAPPYQHRHDDGVGDETKWYCVSTSGSGTDCPPAPQCDICESSKHPADGPFGAVGPLASSKNALAVGAVFTSKVATSFSSRGPAADGRVKPDVVAKGISVYSSVPTNSYASTQGTSMSSPVVTGIAALLVEQWRKTMGAPDPPAATMRALIIQGAEDVGNAGPDYTHGFGLVNAKNSADIIRDDNRTGSRIRTGAVQQGARFEVPMTVAGGDIRVTLAWDDNEAQPEPLTALVNDLDLRLIGPGGEATLPYILDRDAVEAVAARGTNRVDTVEQVELKNAPAGIYRVEVVGNRVGAAGQGFTVVGSGQFGAAVATCTDLYEPNDTEATAYGPLVLDQELNARVCGASDVDFYRIVANATGPVSIFVRATDSPIRVTLTGGPSPVTADVQAGQTATLTTVLGSGSGQPAPLTTFLVRVEPIGTPGTVGGYSLRPTFGFIGGRRRSAAR